MNKKQILNEIEQLEKSIPQLFKEVLSEAHAAEIKHGYAYAYGAMEPTIKLKLAKIIAKAEQPTAKDFAEKSALNPNFQTKN